MLHVYIIDNIVIGTVAIYVDGATAIVPVGSVEYILQLDSLVGIGWSIDLTVSPPVFSPPSP